MPAWLSRGLNEDTVEFLTDEDTPRRVELNALRPREFIDMLEVGVSVHVTEKLIPTEAVLSDTYRELFVQARLRELEAELSAHVSLPASHPITVRQVQDALPDQAVLPRRHESQ